MNNISSLSMAFNNYQSVTKTLNSSIAPWAKLILAASVTGLAGLAAFRFFYKPAADKGDEMYIDKKTQTRIQNVYKYVIGGIAITAAAALISHISGLSGRILRSPMLMIPTFLVSIVSLVTTMCADKDSKVKLVAWGIFTTSMGVTLSPIGFFDKIIIAQAAAITVGLGSLLTFIAYNAPDKRFLQWEGPLMGALSAISLASFVSIFFPNSAFAYGVDRVSLYGGLAIFCGLFMASTQQILDHAQKDKKKDFDPINLSLGLYLDTLNLFVRILRILAENQDKNGNKEQLTAAN